jgi:2-phospho-L-lactate guanylyltransferase
MGSLQTWAVLPGKRLDEAKSRLDSVLAAAERRALAETLFEHCLEVLRKSPAIDRTLVVSSDPGVLARADAGGAATIAETEAGLNPALTLARAHALETEAGRLLVLASDLPFLSVDDLGALLMEASAPVVIAPDRRRLGTNALLVNPPGIIDFAFGEDSFQRHLNFASAAGLSAVEVNLLGLAFDVDLPQDWQDLLATGWRLTGREPKPASVAAAAPDSRAPGLPDPHPSA